jgi:hypothetical protein
MDVTNDNDRTYAAGYDRVPEKSTMMDFTKRTINDVNNTIFKDLINNTRDFQHLNKDELEKKFLIDKERIRKIEVNEKIQEAKKKNLDYMNKQMKSLGEIVLKKKLKSLDMIIAFLILVNVLAALLENHFFTTGVSHEEHLSDPTQKEAYSSDNMTNLIRLAICGVIGLIEILLFIRYSIKVKILKSLGIACNRDGILSTGQWKPFLVEFFILLILSPPGFDDKITGSMLGGTYTYTYDSIFLFFTLTKLYYFLKIYTHISIWSSDKVHRIGLDNKINIGVYFAIKAQIKKNPFFSMIVILIVSISLLGFMMRIFEYGYVASPSSSDGAKSLTNPDFKSYTDVFWVIIITMMTVGYGDIFPHTHLGRFVAFLCALIGLMVTSLLIVSLSYIVEFSPEEKKAHNMIKKREANIEMNRFSGIVVRAVMKLYLSKRSDYYLVKNKNQ